MEEKRSNNQIMEYMKKRKLWGKEYENKIIVKATREVEEAVKKAEAIPKPKVDDMFKFVYKNMTKRQKKELETFSEKV